MKLSKTHNNLIAAYNKGYVVDEKGDVYYKNRKRILIPDTHGYATFTIRVFDADLSKDVFRRIWVHQLQAYQKFGRKIFKKNVQVRHLNSKRLDNSFDNIGIGSPSKNAMDKPKETRQIMAIIASHKNRVLTDEQIKELVIDRNLGMNYDKLMSKYGITSKGTLSYIINKAHYNSNKRS